MQIWVCVSSTSVLVRCMSSMGVLTTVVVEFDDLQILEETEITTGWECHSMTCHLERKIARVKRSANNIPTNM